MVKEVSMERKRVYRWNGITRCAERLGISRCHLSFVMRGERKPGKDLEKRMRRMGLVPGSAGKIEGAAPVSP